MKILKCLLLIAALYVSACSHGGLGLGGGVGLGGSSSSGFGVGVGGGVRF